MKNILYSLGLKDVDTMYGNMFKEMSNLEFQFILINHRKYVPIVHNAQMLDELYRNKNPKLMKLYSDVKDIIFNNNIDILIVGTDNPYHPDFLKTLPIYKVLTSSDDPGASYSRTVPYVHAFDMVTCVNIPYHRNDTTPMPDKLIEWGAKKSLWLPYGVEEGRYDPNLTTQDIINKPRPIDILYIGAFYREKFKDILKVKDAFGSRFKIYGNWKLANIHNIKEGKLIYVRQLPPDKFVATYQKAKIGINIHMHGELGNGRLYQLPANGVMQICDCKNLLYKVFEPNKEIVGYETIEEAIELIKYYLNHENERIKIAVAGFEKTKKYYIQKEIIKHLVEKVIEEKLKIVTGNKRP